MDGVDANSFFQLRYVFFVGQLLAPPNSVGNAADIAHF
jgi:hypothetical protein